jgi:isopentenyldiphosphate isomerase
VSDERGPRHPAAPTRQGQDPDEPFDVLDAEGRPTGSVKARHEVHRDGDWHAAVHVWIVDEEGRLLIQRRSPYKDLAPGKLDVTVGGHLRAGERWPSALREVEEEIGRAVDMVDVRHLGTLRSERTYPGAIDREHQEILVARLDGPLTSYRLDPNEVDALYAVPIDRATALWRDGAHVAVEGWDAQARPAHALLHEGDLIPEARASQLEELRLVAAWAQGEDAQP